MKRIACVLILSIATVAILFLVACSSGQDNGLSEYNQLLESVSQSNDKEEPEPFAEKVYIIIPRSCSGELSLKADAFADAIKEKTGVYALVKYDNEDIIVNKNELTVLLGNTERLESQEAIKPLRYEDYVCGWDKGSIILGGRHDEATIKAVDRFMDEILHGASNVCLMSEGAHFENIVDRDISSVTLNGYDLYDYTLVYSEENSFGEKEMAELLREYAVSKSGYMLDIIPDSEVDSNTGKIISVSGLPDTNGAVIRNQEQNIIVSGAEEYELSVSVARFAEELFENVIDGKANATVADINIPCTGNNLKICYAVSKGANKDLDFIHQWSVLVQNDNYDVIIFDQFEPLFLKYVEKNNYDYEYIALTDSNGNVYPVMYNRDAFQSFECSISYAAIEIKAKAEGELEERRIVVSHTSNVESINSLLEGSTAYDMFVFKEALSEETEKTYGLSLLGSESWSFDGAQSKTVFYTKEALLSEGKLKADGGIFESGVNLFVSAELSPRVCAELERLKNTLK